MTRKIYCFTIIAFCLSVSVGCEKKPFDIKFEKETIDFGTVDAGENVEAVFRFKNLGTETIEIKLVRPTCGCIIAGDWDQTVEPGETGRIPVTFNSGVYEGEVRKVNYVDTNIPGRESISLVLKGIVYNPVVINPKTTWLGMILNEEEPLHGSFPIKYNLDSPFEVTDIVLPDDKTTAWIETVKPLEEYILKFTVQPPLQKYDPVSRKIILRIGGKINKDYVLYYSYQVPPPIQVNPMVVEVDMEKVSSEQIERRINIKSNIESPISIIDLKFDGTGVGYSVEELRKDMFLQIPLVFPVGFTFPEDKKIFYLSFRVKNDPRDILYKIRIEAFQR
ncbi:MAG: DUF1573 domain-containing protein [Spirochaetales bacterium]|nr:DUF1573 domain-containing protein [Spirochaetales bacterium]